MESKFFETTGITEEPNNTLEASIENVSGELPERPWEVIGRDSLGNNIVSGSRVFLKSNSGISIETIATPARMSNLSGETAGVVITEDTLSEIDNFIDVELFPPETWIKLSDLQEKDDAYWARMESYGKRLSTIKNVTLAMARKTQLTKAKDVARAPGQNRYLAKVIDRPDDALSFTVPGTDYSQTIISYDNRWGEINMEIASDAFGGVYRLDWTEDEIVAPAGITAPSMGIVEKDGGQYIAFFKAVDKEQPPVQETFERLQSTKEVAARLQIDFPWVVEADLGKRIAASALFDFESTNNPMGGLSDIDSRRIENIYPLFRRTTAEWGIRNREPNEFEELYIKSRNYAYLCEFAARIALGKKGFEDQNAADSTINEKLSSISPEERRNMALELLAEIENNTNSLLQHRWDLETKLFDEPIVSPFQRYIQRFSGQGTMHEYAYAAGLYMNGILAIMTESDFSSDLGAEYTDEALTHIVLQRVAEVTAHEIGHSGLGDTLYDVPQSGDSTISFVERRSNWEYEEAWNEWKSVVFPRDIEKPWAGGTLVDAGTYFNSKYHYKVERLGDQLVLANGGGARAIEKMLEAVSRETGTLEVNGREWEISREFAQKCALATAFARQETGVFQFKGQEVVGFKDLFDAFAKKYRYDSYSQRLRGSKDSDYKNYSNFLEQNSEDEQNTFSSPAPTVKLNAEASQLERDVRRKLHQKLVEAVNAET